jgi:hypothetical protein
MSVSLPSQEVADAVAAGPYGVELEVDTAGILTIVGYDWSDSMLLARFLVQLGVDPKTAKLAAQEAAFSAASRVLEGR